MAIKTLNEFEEVLGGGTPFESYMKVGGLWIVPLDYELTVAGETPVDFRNIGYVVLKYVSGQVVVVDAKFLLVTPENYVLGEDKDDGLDEAIAVLDAALADFSFTWGSEIEPKIDYVEESVTLPRQPE